MPKYILLYHAVVLLFHLWLARDFVTADSPIEHRLVPKTHPISNHVIFIAAFEAIVKTDATHIFAASQSS